LSTTAQERGLWHTDAEAAHLLAQLGAGLPRKPGPVDLLIVGSGYTGLSAALRAARAGASVLVLDAGPIAGGASSVNGGTYGPGFPISAQLIARVHGRSVARAVWDISSGAVRAIERMSDEMEIDCFREGGGNLKLAVRESHFAAFERYASWLDALVGQAPQPIRPECLPGELGMGRFAGGLLERNAGQLHPRRFAAGLAALATKCGVRFMAHTRVLSVREGTDGCSVTLGAGEIRARRILIATNCTSDLLPSYTDRLIEIGSYMIATQPLPPAVRMALFPEGRTYSTSQRLFNYFRTDRAGCLLFGGRNSLLPNLPGEASRAALEKRMVSLLPVLAQMRVSQSWGGRIAFFRDALPRVGAASARVFFALGFGGQGLTMANFGGMLAAELIVGGGAGRPPFDLPLPSQGLWHPGRESLRLLGWFYRALDALD